MLILTRRVGETLMIGDEVTVTVLGVKGNQYVLVLTLLKKYLSTVKIYQRIRAEKIPAVQLLILSRLAVGRDATLLLFFLHKVTVLFQTLRF